MAEEKSKLVEWHDTAKKVSIGSLVAAAILGVVYSSLLDSASKALSDVTASTLNSYSLTNAYQRATTNAQAAMAFFYIAVGVAAFAVICWLASSLLIAYKES
ncbi:MAG: hypothetical protein LKK55_01880 [Olsenella sp.]|jgi:ABC-type glycerol-3-phosphate transport system permease component|nr:hypothetical protein [Olsenella sp.]